MKKVLVVDDEEDILEIIKMVLNYNNFSVETTSKWRNVFTLIRSFSPHLILLDVALGGADGRQICNELKSSAETKHIPVVLCSAHYNLIGNLNGCSPDAVITKPFDTKELVDVIRQHIN